MWRDLVIAFRVDSSLNIGSGHVMRCLTMADHLKAKGARCHFISRMHPGNLLQLIRKRGFDITTLPGELSNLGCHWQIDAEQTRSVLLSLKPDWLVVDHYGLDHHWEATLLPNLQKLIVIDDLAD